MVTLLFSDRKLRRLFAAGWWFLFFRDARFSLGRAAPPRGKMPPLPVQGKYNTARGM